MGAPLPVAEPRPGGPGAPGRPWRTDAALNPRALPTDTSVRFLLLLAAVVAASLYLYDALWFVLRGETFLDVLRGCGLEVGDLAAGSVADTATVMAEQTACRSAIDREQSLFALGGTALVLAAAYGAYRLLPRWRVRRAGLVALDPVDGAALHDAVAATAGEAGLDRAPEVLVDATNPAVQAFVFGTARRPRLGVTGGLVVLQVLDPAGFRAVLRHEMAHLANRDVPWAYYTVAVWWCFVGLALVPVVGVLAFSDLTYVLRLGWRTVLLAALVLLVRNAVLRSREAYADARAAEWGSAPDLTRLLAAGATAPAAGESRLTRHRLLRRHPSAVARRALLADPDGLFSADVAVAFVAGVSTGVAFASVQSITTLLLPSAVGVWVAAGMVAPLLAVLFCVTAWRAGLRSAVRGSAVAVAGPLALGAGAGLALGPILSFQAAAGAVVVGASGAAGYVVWGLGVLAVTGLLARYAADAGRVAVRTGLHGSSPRPFLAAHAIAVTAATAALLAYGHLALLWLGSGGPLAALTLPVWAFLPAWFGDDGLLLLAALGLLVLAPLLARRRRARLAEPAPSAAGPWAWRQQPPPDVPRPLVPSLGTALAVAVLVGGAAAGWHVLARLVSAVALEESVRLTDSYKLALGAGTTILVGAAMIVGAAAAAVLLPRRWWTLGGLGGLAALVAGGAGILTAQVAAGCGLLPRAGPPDCSPPRWGELTTFVWQPLVFAAAWTALALAAVGVVRHVVAGRQAAAPEGRPGSARVVLVGIAALAAVAVPGVGTLAVVANTETREVTGPGYTIALPATWTETPNDDGVPLLSTINQRVRVELRPVPETAPPASSAELEVGGVRAWFIGELSEVPLVLRAYDLSAPAGTYRLSIVGTPEALDAAADEELATLLAAVRWSG